MLRLPIAIAGLALTVSAAVAAENTIVRVASGLPQVSLVGGHAVAWRFVTLRADTPFIGLEAKLPTCIDALHSATPLPMAPAGPAHIGCAEVGGDATSGLGSQQLKARLRAPRVFDGGPEIEFALLAWRPSSRAATSISNQSGSSAEVEVTQPLGSVRAFAGYSAPIGSPAPADDWRTVWGGIKWKPLAGHSLELSVDQSQQRATGDRDREATLQYSYARGKAVRWRFLLTRLVDNPVNRWRSGFGMDWAL